MLDLISIQNALRERGLHGWLFYDHHHRDPIAYRVLGLSAAGMVTRRWFYLIPAEGEPVKLVHRIEDRQLDSLPGRKLLYSAWGELQEGLREMVAPLPSVAMQYSPLNAIPYISLVDAGTVELVRSIGPRVVSSADLVQLFEARWSPAAFQTHLEAGQAVDRIMQEAFQEIGRAAGRQGGADEYAIQQFILERFAAAGLVTEDPPIVAVNQNSGNPHYEPSRERSAPIRAGDFVLLDMWAKTSEPGAVYYDITWVGYLGARPPAKIEQVFSIVSEARNRAVNFVVGAINEGRTIQGWQVDQAARSYIAEQGYGQYFTHRTGHSIGESIHANGANMDNLETHDERQIVPFTCFSVEPGIYLPEFGVRSEVNVFVDERQARVTGAVQKEIVRIGE